MYVFQHTSYDGFGHASPHHKASSQRDSEWLFEYTITKRGPVLEDGTYLILVDTSAIQKNYHAKTNQYIQSGLLRHRTLASCQPIIIPIPPAPDTAKRQPHYSLHGNFLFDFDQTP